MAANIEMVLKSEAAIDESFWSLEATLCFRIIEKAHCRLVIFEPTSKLHLEGTHISTDLDQAALLLLSPSNVIFKARHLETQKQHHIHSI